MEVRDHIRRYLAQELANHDSLIGLQQQRYQMTTAISHSNSIPMTTGPRSVLSYTNKAE
jgi:glucuronate isomerase